MVVFPNAKINLGLNIVAKRTDGYHNLESCFVPIPWHDILEVIHAPALTFSTSGLPIPGHDSANLCLRAFHLLQADFPLSPVHIHLHKIIPMGAGLGGGSADGAFTLVVLNELFDLRLSPEILMEYAEKLGSDCPFFIRNQAVLATGKGTEFHPINLSLKGLHLVVVKPDIHVSTAEAYAGVRPSISTPSVKEILETLPMEGWTEVLKNDFEASVFARYPDLRKLKESLYQLGAKYAAMSGSGSAIFGLFDQPPVLPDSFLQMTHRIMQLP
jgi:4-diphosphocytidyl-2-C-methyl-D-erythritol kinase